MQLIEDNFFNIQNTGVQGISGVYASVNKVQNPFIDALIFDLVDGGVYVVYALYSRVSESVRI
jgi:hypothetical protein